MKLNIGHKLLAIRTEKEISQAEMAHLLEIPDATYSRYERNETQVSYDKIAKFAEILKIPLQELLPENMSVQSNNNHHSGQGSGALILGNQYQYIYMGDNVAYSQIAKEKEDLSKENQELKEKLNALEQKLEEILRKL